ncbi:MAG TPA: hypothetical protein VM165_26215 [Planctomycetaceae bacterium]|nr:hypothetical protein [Planctomycetaceae bacterium]
MQVDILGVGSDPQIHGTGTRHDGFDKRWPGWRRYRSSHDGAF